MTTTTLSEIWPVLLSIFGAIVWLIRLESKVNYLEKDYERYKEAAAEKDKVMWAKLDSLQATMNTVLQTLGEIKGKISE